MALSSAQSRRLIHQATRNIQRAMACLQVLGGDIPVQIARSELLEADRSLRRSRLSRSS